MDFKIGDDLEENTSDSPRKTNSKLPIIIVVVVSLLCGLLVFFVSNLLFGVKKTEEVVPTATVMDVDDEDIQILYQYVTYGVKNTRNDKFIKDQSVKMEDFTNDEKFYYALQFAQVEDFASTGQVDDDKRKIYNISSAKIKTYMQRFFGPQVTYSTSSIITYPFSFRINSLNVGVLTYNSISDGFDTVFTSFEDDIEDDSVVKDYYTKLNSATKETDNTIKINEKIIYTDYSVDDDGYYTIKIYKDYAKTMLLETKTNLKKEELESNPINIDDYIEKAATITYVFKANLNYYFYSSTITN
jgi:hypothetical protein